MFIVEQKYGNDGYAFWFKLLELMGKANGHYIDCSNEATWEFLQAKTHQSNGFCDEILDLLAKLDAIDKDLWIGYRVIWSQNFVDGVASVYANRKRQVPKRPDYSKKPRLRQVTTNRNTTKPNNTTDKNTQSIVE